MLKCIKKFTTWKDKVEEFQLPIDVRKIRKLMLESMKFLPLKLIKLKKLDRAHWRIIKPSLVHDSYYYGSIFVKWYFFRGFSVIYAKVRDFEWIWKLIQSWVCLKPPFKVQTQQKVF